MAITISKEPQGALLNAYNNSVLEFSSDTGTSARALIEISGYVFEVTPNKGLFYFNMREVIILLINQNAFADDMEVVVDNQYLLYDSSLYLEQLVKITVIKSNGASETLSKTYKYLKSVVQLYRTKYNESDLVKVLLPYAEGRNNATYFEGLPFDVSIFSNADRNVTLLNRRTTQSMVLNLVKGVNRLYLSNGENDNDGFEKILPLYIGHNDLEIQIDANNKILLPIKKAAVDCGIYLKWFNQQGSWSYWRFDKYYRENVGSKKLDELNSDFNNIGESRSPTISTGKETARELSLDTGLMDLNERILVDGIFQSPKVYIYSNEQLQPFNKYDWKDVDIANGSQTVFYSKNHLHGFKITVNLPKQYNQTYAS